MSSHPALVRWIHLGLAVFGIAAYLTGELAEDGTGLGYLLHAYLGLTLTVAILSRTVYGLIGATPFRFSQWLPIRRSYLSSLKEDYRELLRLRLPQRRDHRGLAGLVQAFGLAIFAWMGLTGSLLYFGPWGEHSVVAEAHEIGEALIPLFLLAHVGAVALHALSGHNPLQRIFPVKSSSRERKA